ncbi:LOW QUALITY PROTEIN: hypothetical protein SORBI_3008G097401 [Sorghum bicolor]|uniref:Yippee domain-containing protein n=1 Tax=Sorghum bicolor TaxID=4558 RepID=A0A1Z5R5R6_SORBI|nr:LOW QUALITY PROTEIN: hypothetical protein SORBI_3008G097401 [Sorghum bicolor]
MEEEAARRAVPHQEKKKKHDRHSISIESDAGATELSLIHLLTSDPDLNPGTAAVSLSLSLSNPLLHLPLLGCSPRVHRVYAASDWLVGTGEVARGTVGRWRSLWGRACCTCRNHVCLHDDIISKAFQGRNGRAFLFSHAMNVVVGAKEDRQLMTGLHTVADIYCNDCREVLGWKYERAYEETQKYKEGKFIFEKSKIVKENW